MREKEKKKERLLQRLEGDGPLFLTPGIECPPPSERRFGYRCAVRQQSQSEIPSGEIMKAKKTYLKTN